MEPVLSSTTRRRGHQHHPRHATRRRLDQSLLTTSSPPLSTSSTLISSAPDGGPAQCGPAGDANDATSVVIDDKPVESSKESPRLRPNLNPGSPRRATGKNSDKTSRLSKYSCDKKDIVIKDKGPAQCGLDDNKRSKLKAPHPNSLSDDDYDEDLSKSPEFEHAVARARGDGNSDEETVSVEEDPEIAELAKLRCPSEMTEIQAQREARRRKRCGDYPGLAFGCSIFSSDTMMKFSLIKNELQNIMGNQLKRVSILV